MINSLSMNDSLQFQLFNQLQSNTYDANTIREQMLQQQLDYNNFRQRMNETALMQSQTLNSNLYRGIVAPTASNFISTQAQGIYSGLGITPQMQATMSQNIMPAISGIRQNVHESMSLPAAMVKARFSNATAALSPEQQQGLAVSLGYGSANVANSAFSGAASVVGAVGGIAAASTVLAKVPLKLAAGAAVGFWGAKKLLTNQTVSSLTGWGNINEGLFSPFQHISEELGESRDWHSYLTNESYRFMSVGSGRTGLGQGLSRSDVHQWSRNIRKLDSKFGVSDTDIQDLVKSSVDNNLIYNIKDYEDFEAKLSKQVKYMKSASKILNKSFSEITDMIGEFKRAGISVDNFDMKAAELKNYASVLGKNIDAVKNFMIESTKLYTMGTTVSPTVTYNQTGNQLTILKYMQENAYNAGSSGQPVVDLINNLGGVEGAQSTVRSAMSSVFASDKGNLLASFFTPNTSGGFTLNEKALDTALTQVKSGSLSFNQLASQAGTYLRSTLSDSQAIAFQNTKTDLLMNQDEDAVNKMFSLLAYSMKGSFPALSGSMETAITNGLGLDSTTSKLITYYLDTYSKEGTKIATSQLVNTYRMQGSAFRQVLAEAKNRGWQDITTEWADTLADAVAIKPVEKLTDSLEDIMARRSGLTTIDYTKESYGGELDYTWNSTENAMSRLQKVENVLSRLSTFTPSQTATSLEGSTYLNWSDFEVNGRNMLSTYSKSNSAIRSGLTNSVYNWDNVKNFFSNALPWETYDPLLKIDASTMSEINKMNQELFTANKDKWVADYINSKSYYNTSSYTTVSDASMNLISSNSSVVPYEDIFQQAASTYGVNVAYLKAIGKIESNYNPTASSGSADGIMQIAKMNQGAGFDVWDPTSNIMKGASMYQSYLERYGGNPYLAAAAYNMGPNGLANKMKQIGYDASTMSQAELLSFDINTLLPYLPAETQGYIPKFIAALGDLGANPDSYTSYGTTKKSITETTLSLNAARDVLQNLNTPGVSLSAEEIEAIKANAGWTTKVIKEQFLPSGVDASSLIGSSQDLLTVANYARNNGNQKAVISAERAMAYLESLATKDVSELDSTEIQTEIDRLKDFLGEFGSFITESMSGMVENAITSLEKNKPTIKTTVQTIATEELLQSISDLSQKGVALVTGLNVVPTGKDIQAKLDQSDIRNSMQTGWMNYENISNTIYNSPIESVTADQVTNLIASVQSISSSASTYLSGDTSDGAKAYREVVAQANEQANNFVKKYIASAKQGVWSGSQGAIPTSSADYAKYSKTLNINDTIAIIKEKEAGIAKAVSSGDAATVGKLMGELDTSSYELTKAITTRTETLNNQLFYDDTDNFEVDDLNFNKAINFLDNRITSAIGGSTTTYNPAEVVKLQNQRNALITVQEIMNSGNLNTIQDIGLLNTKDSLNTIRSSLFGEVSGVLKNTVAENKINEYIELVGAGMQVLSPESSTTSLEKIVDNKANYVKLVSGGKYTDTYNDYKTKMEKGTFSLEDYNALKTTALSGTPESIVAKNLLSKYEQARAKSDSPILGSKVWSDWYSGQYGMPDTAASFSEQIARASVDLSGLDTDQTVKLLSGGTVTINGKSLNLNALDLASGALTTQVIQSTKDLNAETIALDDEIITGLYSNITGVEYNTIKKMVDEGLSSTEIASFMIKQGGYSTEAATWVTQQLEPWRERRATVTEKKATLDDALLILDTQTREEHAAKLKNLDVTSSVLNTMSGITDLMGLDSSKSAKIIADFTKSMDSKKASIFESPERYQEIIKSELTTAISKLVEGSSDRSTSDVVTEMSQSSLDRIEELASKAGTLTTTQQENLSAVMQQYTEASASGDIAAYVEAATNEGELLGDLAKAINENNPDLTQAETSTNNLTKAVKLYYDAVDSVIADTNGRVSEYNKDNGIVIGIPFTPFSFTISK